MTLLDFERSNISGAVSARRSIEQLLDYVKTDAGAEQTKHGGRTRTRAAIADLAVKTEVMFNFSLRIVTMQANGMIPNYEASTAKLFNSELAQDLARIGMKVFGLYSNLWDPDDPRAPAEGSVHAALCAHRRIHDLRWVLRDSTQHHRHARAGTASLLGESCLGPPRPPGRHHRRPPGRQRAHRRRSRTDGRPSRAMSARSPSPRPPQPASQGRPLTSPPPRTARPPPPARPGSTPPQGPCASRAVEVVRLPWASVTECLDVALRVEPSHHHDHHHRQRHTQRAGGAAPPMRQRSVACRVPVRHGSGPAQWFASCAARRSPCSNRANDRAQTSLPAAAFGLLWTAGGTHRVTREVPMPRPGVITSIRTPFAEFGCTQAQPPAPGHVLLRCRGRPAGCRPARRRGLARDP